MLNQFSNWFAVYLFMIRKDGKKLVHSSRGWCGEKGLAEIAIICRTLHHFFNVFSFLFCFFSLTKSFYKVANDVVNGTGNVICMKGQCRDRLLYLQLLLKTESLNNAILEL